MAIHDFQNFSDGADTYRVKDATARSSIAGHEAIKVTDSAGAHGLRYTNGILAYKDANNTWQEIKTGAVVELTQEQYDNLSQEAKNLDIIYMITDASGVPFSSATLPYDNSESGLNAEFIQDAVDEIAGSNVSYDSTNKTLFLNSNGVSYNSTSKSIVLTF